MATYKPGDRVIVTRPRQPTHHQGGESGVVEHVSDGEHGQLVRIVERGGGISVVWALELSPATH